MNYTICCILYALENKLSTDPPNKVEIEKDGTRTELKFNKETVIETVIKTDTETDIVSALLIAIAITGRTTGLRKQIDGTLLK